MDELKPLPCIACGTVPKQLMANSLQPVGAVMFEGEAAFGSRFDLMSSGTTMTLNVCDECLRRHRMRVLLTTSRTTTEYEYKPLDA